MRTQPTTKDPMRRALSEPRLVNAHQFNRDTYDHYVEEQWCSDRLFDEIAFIGPIYDPCCGGGRILKAAAEHGYAIIGSDIMDRPKVLPLKRFRQLDFLSPDTDAVKRWARGAGDIVCNVPFGDRYDRTKRTLLRDFYARAIVISRRRVAMIFPVRRLAAATWLEQTSLDRIIFMNPRPSMPTGEYITSGGKVGGGRQDYVWLIWDRHRRSGSPCVGWVIRDEAPRLEGRPSRSSRSITAAASAR